MADEICIPTDRVPLDILEKLKEIGLLVQSENVLSTSAPDLSAPSNRDSNNDEVDYFRPSASSSSSAVSDIVSVLKSEVTSHEDAQTQPKNIDDVVSLFAPPKSSSKDRKPAAAAAVARPADHDVVSLFDTRPSLSPSKEAATPPKQSPRQEQQQQQQQQQQQSQFKFSPGQSTNSQVSTTPQFGLSPSKPITPQSPSQQQSLFRCQSYPPQTREIGHHQHQYSHHHHQQQLQQHQQLQQQHHHQYAGSPIYSEVGDYFGSLSSSSQQRPSSALSTISSVSSVSSASSLAKKRSSSQGEVLDAVVGQHQHLRRDFHSRSPPVSPAKRARSPSDSESSYYNAAASSSAATFSSSSLSLSPHSSRSRSTPSLPFCSAASEDDGGSSSSSSGVFRALPPPRQVTPPPPQFSAMESSGPRSPKMLTPPETPELEGKRVVPEIFTFDDFTCTQERFLMSIERLQQLHEQSNPSAKRAPSTPRKNPSAPSTPPTPSYRRPEVPQSPSFLHMSSTASGSRRPSPVDQRLLQCLEAAAAASASSPKKKTTPSEVPDSPTTASMQSPLQRLTMEEYTQPPSQRRDSVSPKPKKRLDFEEESHPMLQPPQRMRNFDPSAGSAGTGSGGATPYPAPLSSPRASGSGSGSENVFTFPAYPPMDGPQYTGRAGPSGMPSSKAALVMEVQERMASLAAYHQEEEEDGGSGDDRMSLFGFTASRSVYDTLDFPGAGRVSSVHGGRYAAKRRRQEPEVDGSDEMATCTCAAMERNFLQMAKCAFTRIRRMNTSDADFDRFRMELAQTNDILRESIGLMKHIREICDHRKRPRW